MAPLIVLLSVFVLLYLVNRLLLGRRWDVSFIGRAAMAAMLVLTGVSHFTNPDPMVAMMPDLIPAKLELVYFTGICELAAVIGLMWDKTSKIASVLLIVFFLMIVPANIAGSLRSIDFGGMGYGPLYLLFRVPLQVFFIWWVWHFGIRAVEPPAPALS
jgi:uncharacterized membrane protein